MAEAKPTKPRRRGPEVLWLKITLEATDPLVWRRVLVHSDTTLPGLHRIIQALMQWQDYHLYEFRIRELWFEEQTDEAEGLDPAGVTLGSLRLEQGERFFYTYDFGDDWRHEIVVEKRQRALERHWLPWVEGGEGAGPPEDCGGTSGFANLLEAIADPDHPEYEEYRQWEVRTTIQPALIAGRLHTFCDLHQRGALSTAAAHDDADRTAAGSLYATTSRFDAISADLP